MRITRSRAPCLAACNTIPWSGPSRSGNPTYTAAWPNHYPAPLPPTSLSGLLGSRGSWPAAHSCTLGGVQARRRRAAKRQSSRDRRRSRGGGWDGRDSGFQPVMARAHARALTVSVMPGKRRCSSTAAANSPSRSKAARIAAAWPELTKCPPGTHETVSNPGVSCVPAKARPSRDSGLNNRRARGQRVINTETLTNPPVCTLPGAGWNCVPACTFKSKLGPSM